MYIHIHLSLYLSLSTYIYIHLCMIYIYIYTYCIGVYNIYIYIYTHNYPCSSSIWERRISMIMSASGSSICIFTFTHMYIFINNIVCVHMYIICYCCVSFYAIIQSKFVSTFRKRLLADRLSRTDACPDVACLAKTRSRTIFEPMLMEIAISRSKNRSDPS